MKKWLVMMLVLGFALPISYVNAEEEIEGVELVSITIEDEAFLEHEEVESIQAYIDEHLDQAFETVYIGWESHNEGVYTFLFSGELTDEQLTDMEELAGDVPVVFEEINYTLAELEAKQIEIVEAGLEYDDFVIYQVGPDMTKGYVTIGIDPFNEENAQVLYDQFGDELVLVEEGAEMSTFDIARTDDEKEMETISLDEDEIEPISIEIEEDQEDNLNWFQRFWRTVRSWFTF